MTAIERTAYPRFKHSFTEDELAQFYTPTEADLAFVENLADDEAQGLTMMLLVKGLSKIRPFTQTQRCAHACGQAYC